MIDLQKKFGWGGRRSEFYPVILDLFKFFKLCKATKIQDYKKSKKSKIILKPNGNCCTICLELVITHSRSNLNLLTPTFEHFNIPRPPFHVHIYVYVQ